MLSTQPLLVQAFTRIRRKVVQLQVDTITMPFVWTNQRRYKQGGRAKKYGDVSAAKKRLRVMGSGNVKAFPKRLGGRALIHKYAKVKGTKKHLRRVMGTGFKPNWNPQENKAKYFREKCDNPLLKD